MKNCLVFLLLLRRKPLSFVDDDLPQVILATLSWGLSDTMVRIPSTIHLQAIFHGMTLGFEHCSMGKIWRRQFKNTVEYAICHNISTRKANMWSNRKVNRKTMLVGDVRTPHFLDV